MESGTKNIGPGLSESSSSLFFLVALLFCFSVLIIITIGP